MQFAVKFEAAAKRCEVCHQSDLFVPVSNFCSRCHTGTALLQVQQCYIAVPSMKKGGDGKVVFISLTVLFTTACLMGLYSGTDSWWQNMLVYGFLTLTAYCVLWPTKEKAQK